MDAISNLAAKHKRLTALQQEAHSLKSQIALADVEHEQKSAALVLDGADAGKLVNPSKKLRARLDELETILPHMKKLVSDEAETLRARVSKLLGPLADAANSEIATHRATLQELSRRFQDSCVRPSEIIASIQSAGAELADAENAGEIIIAIESCVADFNLNLEQDAQ